MVLSMERWKGKVAIVTGAGSGIGAAIAERLVEEGLQVAGLDIRSEGVKSLALKLQDKKGSLHAIRTDIAEEEDVLRAFKWVSENLGPVHILINNAGLAKQTDLTDGDTALWKRTLDTNVLGLCMMTREAVKVMRQNNIDGHIVHISSITAHRILNVPFLNVYPASKHAVKALTETLRQELNRLGLKIKITSVSPGSTDTNIIRNNNIKMDPKMLEAIKSGPILQPEDIADAVLYVLSTPPHVQVHELFVKPLGETE